MDASLPPPNPSSNAGSPFCSVYLGRPFCDNCGILLMQAVICPFCPSNGMWKSEVFLAPWQAEQGVRLRCWLDSLVLAVRAMRVQV